MGHHQSNAGMELAKANAKGSDDLISDEQCKAMWNAAMTLGTGGPDASICPALPFSSQWPLLS